MKKLTQLKTDEDFFADRFGLKFEVDYFSSFIQVSDRILVGIFLKLGLFQMDALNPLTRTQIQSQNKSRSCNKKKKSEFFCSQLTSVSKLVPENRIYGPPRCLALRALSNVIK